MIHQVTQIEHYLLDIIHILCRDLIQNTIDDIDRCKATTDILQPTLRNFFYKRWPIIFFYGSGCFFVQCCRKYLQCRSARLFVRAQPKLCFGRHRHVLICQAWKKLTKLCKKKHDSPGDADRTFPIRHHPYIIQGFNTKYNNRHRSF